VAQKMKIWTVLVGVKLQVGQHPKTPVIHKVGYGSGSDISRGLYTLADTGDGGHAGPTSFFAKLCGIRQKPEILHSDFGFKVPEGGFDPLHRWMIFYCAPPFRSTSAISHRALLSFISSSMPLIALLFGIRLPSGRRRERSLTTANDVFLDTVQRDKKIFGSISITSWIKERGGTYRDFVQVFPAIGRRASGES